MIMFQPVYSVTNAPVKINAKLPVTGSDLPYSQNLINYVQNNCY